MQNLWLTHPQLIAAVTALKSGGVIAYPTEGVWGLGCLPDNQQALERILVLKQRPVHKGVILVADSFERVADYIGDISAQERLRLQQSWPGPNTWLVPHSGKAGAWITGQHQLLALRVSVHPVVQALTQLAESALVSTSANPQGLAPAANAEQVTAYFGSQIDVLAPGDVGANGKPTSIRDLRTNQLLRPA